MRIPSTASSGTPSTARTSRIPRNTRARRTDQQHDLSFRARHTHVAQTSGTNFFVVTTVPTMAYKVCAKVPSHTPPNSHQSLTEPPQSSLGYYVGRASQPVLLTLRA